MNMPTYDHDHYILDNGEKLNQAYPDTYFIPDKKERENVNTGDIVKLVFRMEETAGSEDLAVERMWVMISKTHDDYYEGVLNNHPAGSNCLTAGQTVFFQPCHIIQIYNE